MFNILALTALLLPFGHTAPTQEAYTYELEVKQLRSPQTVVWGYWLAGKAYAIDSVKIDSAHSVASFNGVRDLPTGLYFFTVGQNFQPLEFVINQEYQLRFATHAAALQDSFSVQKSTENEPYFAWKRQKKTSEDKIALLKRSLQSLQKISRDRAELERQAASIKAERQKMDAFTRDQQKQFPGRFFAALIRADLPPEIPERLQAVLSDGKVNPAYMQYFRAHFWDEYDFSDERLLRSPAPARKTDDWLQIQTSNLDSVKAQLDLTLRLAESQPNVRRTFLNLFMERFDLPSYGGNETMMTYLFDRYFPSATAVGLDTAAWMRLEYKANAYRPTLPGRIAPNIELKDRNGELQSLYNVKARYTLLYFFSPQCAHCKVVTPDVYAQTLPYAERGIRVFAVTADGYPELWKQYVAETTPEWTCVFDPEANSAIEKMYATQNLPNLLILDEQKKIVVRRLPLGDLPKVLGGL